MHIISSPRQQSHHYTSSRCFIKKSNGCKLSTSPPGRKKIVLVWYNNKTFQFNLSLLVWSFTSYTTHTSYLMDLLKYFDFTGENGQKLWIILCVKWGRTVFVVCYNHWTYYTVPGICVDYYKKFKTRGPWAMPLTWGTMGIIKSA